MLLIPCPCCGPRAESEFRWRGDARVKRPRPEALADDAGWLGHLFWRPPADGTVEEIWFHEAGCRQFIVVTRDTRTHAIHGARATGSAA